MTHRNDNNTLRVIVGNDIAVEAARSGNTNPWPDEAILGKVVWKDTELKDWQAATAPGEFVHAEFMFKDSTNFTDPYGEGSPFRIIPSNTSQPEGLMDAEA